MNKQNTPSIHAHLLRGALYLLLLLPVCVSPFARAQRNTTKLRRGQVRQREQRIALPGNLIVVTNTDDSGPGSLRNALAVANDGDTIDATGVSGTILLTSGELQITHSVTINGPGAENLAVNGNATFVVFHNFASNATISGFTITNGNGGGIVNRSRLTLSDSSVVSNAGGGIDNDTFNRITTLTITNSTVSGNSTTGSGGGIFTAGADGDATLTVSNSTISGNSANANGGGIFGAALSLSHGASSMVTVRNSTISGNSAAGDGGAIYNAAGSHSTAELDLDGTILNAGGSGENIFNDGGTVISRGYNLASDNGGGVLTGPGDQIDTDPMLGPLQDNGGPTFTHALLPGSPAINAGEPNFVPPPYSDQRGLGFDRVRGGRIDVGSFEVQNPPSPSPTPTATPTPRPASTPRPRPTPLPRPTPG